MDALFYRLGALSGLLAVAAGAFGSHALRARLTPEYLAVFETGARYQMYHALALLVVGWLTARHCTRWTDLAGISMTAGTLIFSGCLYALVLSGAKVLGLIVPVGGLLLIIGWLCLAAAAWQDRSA